MKIKEIKIVNQDQSTEVANIGADAINVDYNDTTVKAELDKLNSDNNTISNKQSRQEIALNNLESEISSLASGSPKGTYQTVAALVSANPDTGVYIVTSDGHVYSWTKNASSAIDLGVYQASDFSDVTINEHNAAFLTITEYGNLIDYNNIKINTYCRSGVETANNDYWTTNFIAIDKNFTIKGLYGWINFFDENKTFISEYINTNTAAHNVTLPANGAFFKVCAANSYLNAVYAYTNQKIDETRTIFEFKNLMIEGDNIAKNALSLEKMSTALQEKIAPLNKPILLPGSNEIELYKVIEGKQTSAQYPSGWNDNDWYSTDFISIEPSTHYIYYKFGFVNWYDNEYTYLSTNTNTSQSYADYTSPATAAYCIVSGHKADLSTEGFYKKDEYRILTKNQNQYLPSLYSIDNYYIDFSTVTIPDKTITSEMLKDECVFGNNFGEVELKKIKDKTIELQMYKCDVTKIGDSSVNDWEVSYNNNTGYNSGKAIPFIYDNTKKYNYLYLPYIHTLIDGYLTIRICDENFKGRQVHQLNGVQLEKKYYLKEGIHTNLAISLKDWDWSKLTNGETYWIVLVQLSDEISPTYSSYSNITFHKIDNYVNQLSDFIDIDSKIYYLMHYGSYSWTEFGSTYYNQGIPVFGFTEEYPLEVEFDDYIKSVASGSPLTGKMINFLGDSITQGVGGDMGGSVVAKPYPTIIAEKELCTCNNYGIAGSTIGGDGSTVSEVTSAIMGYLPMNSRIANLNTDAHYNVVFGGINDATADRKVPLGELGDETNLTFYGALDIIAKYMLNNFSTKKNAFITPPRNKSENNNNPFGVKVKDYVNAVIEVGNKYGIPVLDMYNNFGGTPTNTAWKNANMSDGVHPNQSYYYDVADKISAFLKTL